jgi:hypothetical protein
MTTKSWCEEISSILDAVERAERALRGRLSRAVPEDDRSLLRALHADLAECRQSAEQAMDRYSMEPFNTYLEGRPLSREQYYVCRARGLDLGTAREVGLVDVDDYDVYRMLCYEDEKSWTYINIHLAPREPIRPGQVTRIGMRFGSAPEECRRRFLRPEQHDFFRDRLPDVYERFRTD